MDDRGLDGCTAPQTTPHPTQRAAMILELARRPARPTTRWLNRSARSVTGPTAVPRSFTRFGLRPQTPARRGTSSEGLRGVCARRALVRKSSQTSVERQTGTRGPRFKSRLSPGLCPRQGRSNVAQLDHVPLRGCHGSDANYQPARSRRHRQDLASTRIWNWGADGGCRRRLIASGSWCELSHGRVRAVPHVCPRRESARAHTASDLHGCAGSASPSQGGIAGPDTLGTRLQPQLMPR